MSHMLKGTELLSDILLAQELHSFCLDRQQQRKVPAEVLPSLPRSLPFSNFFPELSNTCHHEESAMEMSSLFSMCSGCDSWKADVPSPAPLSATVPSYTDWPWHRAGQPGAPWLVGWNEPRHFLKLCLKLGRRKRGAKVPLLTQVKGMWASQPQGHQSFPEQVGVDSVVLRKEPIYWAPTTVRQHAKHRGYKYKGETVLAFKELIF